MKTSRVTGHKPATNSLKVNMLHSIAQTQPTRGQSINLKHYKAEKITAEKITIYLQSFCLTTSTVYEMTQKDVEKQTRSIDLP